MRATEFIVEGGWASTKTQGTVITPQLIHQVVGALTRFNALLNKHLETKNLPGVKIGHPVGSGTYYQRDMEHQPTKEYGDIDVQFIMPRIQELNNNQNQQVYFDAVKEFCNANPKFETENGKNVILNVGNNYVQVDLVAMFSDTVSFADILAPEWNTKGVLSASLYSAMGEMLHLSISSFGIQAKRKDGQLVKYATQKGTTLHTVSVDKDNWGVDIVKFYGCKKLSPSLQANPGMKDEVRISDIVATIRGIAETLELNDALPDGMSTAQELLRNIKGVYLQKIGKVINSSKFDKAATPEAVAKAEKTKQVLATRSQEIANLI